MSVAQAQLLDRSALDGIQQMWMLRVLWAIPVSYHTRVNPPDIVTIEGDEFRIDMNNMEPLRHYIMKFDGSTYVIWKNDDGALVMDEVEA